MSLINRYHVKKHALPIKRFSLIFVRLTKSNLDKELSNFIVSKTIESINPENIFVYENPDIMSSYSDIPNAIEINFLNNNSVIKLYIIKQFLLKNRNIITIDNDYGMIDNIENNYGTNDKIYFIGDHSDIDSSLIIVPVTDKTIEFINYAIDLSKTISPEQRTLNKILLHTIKVFSQYVGFIDRSKIFHPTSQKYFDIREHALLNKFNYNRQEVDLIKKLFTESNFHIYYPYLDINLHPINDISSIYNTNGFYHDKTKNIYKLLFRRFSNKDQGLFIEKTNNITPDTVIPKIIHHFVWSNDASDSTDSNKNYWKKILRAPWMYKLWDNTVIQNELQNNRWDKFFRMGINNPAINKIITKIAILEKYGGIAVEENIVPIKIFTPDILSNGFFLSLNNNFPNGAPILSFDVMGSVNSLIYQEPTDTIVLDPARKPFVGKNNFFINLKEESKQKMFIKNNDIDQLFQNFYILVQNLQNIITMDDIDNFFTEYAMPKNIVTIYPHYYFNFSPNNLFFKHNAFCLDKQKALTNTADYDSKYRTKTLPARNYQTTSQSMIASLMENPLNRYTITQSTSTI